MRVPAIVFLFSAFLVATGCDSPSRLTNPDVPVRVLTTTSIIADAVREVGGSRVTVTALMPPGIDPHRYIPRPGDAVALSNADVVFYNGLHLEGKMVDVLERTTVRGHKPVAVTRSLDPARDLRHAQTGADGPHDPHVWFDVPLWAKCIDPIRDALVDADPAHADEYRANADAYRLKLLALDRELREKVATVPKGRRILVTSHDAFHYFAAAYDFEVHGLQGISTASEVSLEDVRVLSAFLIDRNVPAVFTETSVNAKGLKSVLDAVAAKSRRTVKLVEGNDALYSDALGEPGTPGETYVGMCRHNVNAIVKALSP